MTPLDEMKRRCEKATPGPWEPFDSGPWGGQGAGVAIGDDPKYWPLFSELTDEMGINNSFFTAHARTDLPKLIEALEVAMEGLEDASGNACSCCDSSDEVWKHCSKVTDRIRQILGCDE